VRRCARADGPRARPPREREGDRQLETSTTVAGLAPNTSNARAAAAAVCLSSVLGTGLLFACYAMCVLCCCAAMNTMKRIIALWIVHVRAHDRIMILIMVMA